MVCTDRAGSNIDDVEKSNFEQGPVKRDLFDIPLIRAAPQAQLAVVRRAAWHYGN
jgi:hypothetical protein